jgi:hypothetical protein
MIGNIRDLPVSYYYYFVGDMNTFHPIDWLDAEDYKWRKVRLMNQVDVSSLPLQGIAFHMCYYDEMFSVV